jgi:hypothetical protein
MRCFRVLTHAYIITALPPLCTSVSIARADAIGSTYTVIDLGFSESSNRPYKTPGPNGVLTSAGGQVYAFPQTFTGNNISTPANFPLADPVPSSTGEAPGMGYSYINGGVSLYPNGIAVATNWYSYSAYNAPGYSWERADIYYVQRNPDGSWGQPSVLISANQNIGSGAGWWPNVSVQLSKSGDVLEFRSFTSGATAVPNDVAVYNIYTHSYTDLSTLPALVNAGYSNLRADLIDDNGDILVWANHQTNPNGPVTDDLVLLIPQSSSSNPNPAASPEPAAWAVMALAIAALAAQRVRERRRRH